MQNIILSKKDFLSNPLLPLRITRVPVGTSTPVHSHEFCELVIITRGTAIHRHGTGEYPVSPGDVFAIDPMMNHGFRNTEHFEVINILFDEGYFVGKYPDLPRLPGYKGLFHLEPAMRSNLDFMGCLCFGNQDLEVLIENVMMISREIETGATGYHLKTAGMFMGCIVDLCREYAKNNGRAPSLVNSLGDAVSMMEYDISRDWKNEELAAIANLSVSSLFRYFSDAFNSTPRQYLISLRLEKVKQQLRETDWTVSRIARETGFNDSNYLARIFRKHTGMSPREFRTLRKDD